MDLDFSPEQARAQVGAEDLRAFIEGRLDLVRSVQRGEAWSGRWLGWLSVRGAAPEAEVARILELAAEVRAQAELMIVVGIGGSNRGAMAAVEALRGNLDSTTRLAWAGDTLSGARLRETLGLVRDKSVVLNVIAKDFNTVEPGIAFRMLREAMEERYGEAWGRRVVVTGSQGSGQLGGLAERHGWRFLDFPREIGGRFSVLSAVGLFPMAVAGVDIRALLAGAAEAERELRTMDPFLNPAVRYAAARQLLLSKGFGLESLVVFEPDLAPLTRWWTQLFAETEGKTQSAIFPTSFSYSEDLHAVGQYVQQGRRFIAETFLRAFRENPDLRIKPSEKVSDGFAYLDGKAWDELNRAVYAAALEAHSRDGVPCLEIGLDRVDEAALGRLFYFFMFSCYLSASLLGVDPFTQDGVEGYKRAMYGILGKRV